MFSHFMVMRAEIRRNAAGKDSYGQKKPPTNATLQGISFSASCYAWMEARQELVDGQLAVVERIKAYFRDDADIQRGDRIEQIVDRRARVLFAGPLTVDSISEKNLGASPSHKEVLLRRHRG